MTNNAMYTYKYTRADVDTAKKHLKTKVAIPCMISAIMMGLLAVVFVWGIIYDSLKGVTENIGSALILLIPVVGIMAVLAFCALKAYTFGKNTENRNDVPLDGESELKDELENFEQLAKSPIKAWYITFFGSVILSVVMNSIIAFGLGVQGAWLGALTSGIVVGMVSGIGYAFLALGVPDTFRKLKGIIIIPNLANGLGLVIAIFAILTCWLMAIYYAIKFIVRMIKSLFRMSKLCK